jgi:hypothetical protein
MANAKLLVEHQSLHGPQVSYVRGILLVKSLENLRAAGLFERYARALPSATLDELVYVLAASWVPVELAMAHYSACDRMELSESEVEQLGARMGENYGQSVVGTLIKAARLSGIEGTWTALRQIDRIWDRMYQGGTTVLFQTGPKDLVLEHTGLPLAESPYFRTALRTYWLYFGRLASRTAYMKIVRPRHPHPHTIALEGSWV